MTRGRKTDEALELIGRLWREGGVDFVGEHFRLTGASIFPKPVQADLPMWIGGGSQAAIRRTARLGTGWLGGPETPAETGKIVAAIRAALPEAGRTIEEDHYGASFPFHFGLAADRILERPMRAYATRTDRDPRDYFAIGDADAIVSRISEYIDAGVSKFVLRPAATSEEAVMNQTQRLIREVLPAVARRWPKA
jgi:alkanesulfonate monooxygenase SsuD/methylene tetrahydromethanopterin reductase-like flavin-dependent oxidoreductase (luciferase family)